MAGTLEVQGQAITRLLNAPPVSTGTAGSAESKGDDESPSIGSDSKPTEHGRHAPPKVEHYDFMRTEKATSDYLSKTRLSPYDCDISYQIQELQDLFLTPAMDEPTKWMSLDAYYRQSNALEIAMESFIDDYRASNTDWRTKGGSAKLFCYKGITTL